MCIKRMEQRQKMLLFKLLSLLLLLLLLSSFVKNKNKKQTNCWSIWRTSAAHPCPPRSHPTPHQHHQPQIPLSLPAPNNPSLTRDSELTGRWGFG